MWGAITEILNMDPMPISIGKVYYSFLDKRIFRSGAGFKTGFRFGVL